MLSIYFFPIWKGLSPRNSIWHFPSVKNENVSLTAVQRCHLWVCGWICLTTKIFNEFSIVWLCVFKLSSSLLLIYNSKPFHYWGPQAKLLKPTHSAAKPPDRHCISTVSRSVQKSKEVLPDTIRGWYVFYGPQIKARHNQKISVNETCLINWNILSYDEASLEMHQWNLELTLITKISTIS